VASSGQREKADFLAVKTRSFARGELNKKVEIASHQVLIRTLPRDALSNCKITWTDLLKRIGMPIGY